MMQEPKSTSVDKDPSVSKERGPARKPSLRQLVLSTLAAAVGVQNKRNHEADFSQTSPLPYIIAGIVFTLLFLIVLIAAAKFAAAS